MWSHHLVCQLCHLLKAGGGGYPWQKQMGTRLGEIPQYRKVAQRF